MANSDSLLKIIFIQIHFQVLMKLWVELIWNFQEGGEGKDGKEKEGMQGIMNDCICVDNSN